MEKVNNDLLDDKEMLDAEILGLYEENQIAITQSNTTTHSRSDWPNLSSVWTWTTIVIKMIFHLIPMVPVTLMILVYHH